MPLDPPAKAGRREWIGLAVIALPCMLYAMDLTVLNLAVPQLTADLAPSAAQLLWIVDIYGFLVAGWLVTMGTLGDRIGRRKLLMIGAALFGVASVLAAFAPTAEALIAARALLGIAGATVAPSTLSLIRNMFHDDRQRTFAISVWGTSYAVGGTIGPIVGGVLLHYFWWGSVFLLAVPVMVLLLVVAPILLPEYRDPKAGRLDIASAALSLAAVLTVIYGLKRMAEDGVGLVPAAIMLAGIGVGALFVRRQKRLADPMIDLALFRRTAFSAALGVNMVGVFVLFGMFLFIAQYLQLVVGLSPLAAALWMLPSSALITVSSLAAPAVVGRFPAPAVLAAGLASLAAGLVVFAFVDGADDLPLLIGGLLVLSAGLGPVFILTTDLIVGAAPPERAGAAGAVSETAAEFGGVLGIAVLGSIAIAVYRGLVGDALPVDIPADVREAARDTLGAALAEGRRIGGADGEAVVAAARSAFLAAFSTVATIGAVVAASASLIAYRLLRTPRDAGGTAAPRTGS